MFASLRFRLLIILFVAVLPLAGLTMYSGLEQRREATRAAQEQALRVARLAASDQQRIIDGTRQLLVTLAQLRCVQEQDAGACALLFADVLRRSPLYQNLVAATAAGDLFCSAVEPSVQLNIAGRPSFRRALESREFATGEYGVSRITGRPTMSFAYPALDAAAGVQAVVVATINLDWLREFMERAGLPPGSTLSVIDPAGAVLARYPDAREWIGRTQPLEVMQPILAQSEVLREESGLDGTPRFYAFTPLGDADGAEMYVRVDIPKNAVLAEANRFLARNMITLGVATLLALAVAWSGGRRFILAPARALLVMIGRLEAGDLGARVGAAAGVGEMGRVAHALDQTAAAVEVREAELRRATARAEALSAIAARLNAHLDLEPVMDAVCREAARALGVPAASVTLCDEGQEAFHAVASLGLPEELDQRISALSPEIVALFEERQVALAADVAAHPDWRVAPLLAALDIRTVVGAPMHHDGQLVGALFIYTRSQVRRFDDDEVGFLCAIADQAAVAVANARLYEALKCEQRLRGELLRHLISAQEEERRRIARELHDETSQGLSVLILSLETVGMELAHAGQQASRPAQMARTVAANLLEGIRRLIGDLRPSLLDDLGLVPAIAWYAEQRLQTQGVEVDLQCDMPDGTRLPPPIETALFRIAQEAISNAGRHSGASKVGISLRIAGGRAVLVVEDDGRGFEVAADPAHELAGRGFGLQGVQERVRILGGELTLHTTPGQGARLEVNVPFTSEEAANGQDSDSPG